MAPFVQWAKIIVLWCSVLPISASSAIGKRRPLNPFHIDEDPSTSENNFPASRMNVLLPGVIGDVVHFFGSSSQPFSSPASPSVYPIPCLKSPQHRCWVFHHMVKSGGTTVKRLVRHFASSNNIYRSEYANAKWLNGIEGTRSVMKVIASGQGIIYGGYAEALRPMIGSGNCKWFTIFRHPVSRLISAFSYCKYMNRNDPLCSQGQIDLDTIDLLSFAQHWGNYGLRQYALAFVSNEEILASPSSRNCQTCPAWYIVKQHLESLQHQASNGVIISPLASNSTDEYSLYMMLEPTLEIVSSRYTAVGILEDMTKTMRLFDSALGMDNFNWTVESKKIMAANENLKRKDEEHAALHEAWTNPAIIKHIWLDLILYDQAMKIFAKQVEQYGLEY